MTYSIVARCRVTGQLGLAVATKRPAVGARVAFLEAGTGSVASQANSLRLHGVEGLALLRLGFAPEVLLAKLGAGDPLWQERQVHLVDADGRSAAHTGTDTVPWAGHLTAPCYSVAGNMLVGPAVLEAMARVFESASGPLSERLLAALAAGDAAGGDKRGKGSAAVRIEGTEMPVDLRVDHHPEPVQELRRIYGVYRETFPV